jgi:hypothetical protein
MSAAVALPLMLGAGALSATAGRSAGYQQASALDQAAQESARQANLTQVAGNEAVRQIGKQATFLRGTQEENAAGGGVASNTGSPLSVAQEDARENIYNQLKTKFQYDSQAFSLNRQAQLQSYYAGKTRQSANLGMVTGLLTTGATAFYQGKGGSFGTSNPTKASL